FHQTKHVAFTGYGRGSLAPNAGVLAPSKSRKIDGFHPAAALGGASAIFPDFFTTALVALVGRGSCAAQAQNPEDEGAKAMSEEIRIYVADL
ncbi:hypothetical protein ACQWJ6_24345, partial [Salmonella enterica subsp. enterica serovar Infantis]